MSGAGGFFTAPRPGELLYSVLARHVRWTFPGCPSAGAQSIFGTRFAAASIDLPNQLEFLADRFGATCSADTLYDEHTLAPYYSAYLPESARLRLRQGMKGNDADLYVSTGLAAFRSGGVALLRFCPDCFDEMVEEWGSAHWRRDHQLPGVLVCPVHGTILKESTVDPRVRNRHEYVAATRSSCPQDARPVIEDATHIKQVALLRIAKASASLLETRRGATDFDELTAYYRQALNRAGFMKSRRMTDQVALNAAFRARFDGVLECLPGLMKEGRLRGGWLEALTRRQRKAVHPLEHLLLRDLLSSRPQVEGDSLRGPWPCRNPLASHHEQYVVEDLRVYRNRGNRVGVFSCQCGYRYTRSIDDAGRLGPPRFREYGGLLVPALRDLVGSGASLRSVAATLQLDPKTVATLALRHGIETIWALRPSGRGVAADDGVDGRVRRQEVSKRVRPPSRPRMVWEVLDAEIRERVVEAASRLRRAVPPVRLTAASIQRNAVGGRDWIRRRQSKLPAAWAEITASLETVTAFQERRITHCIRTISHEGDGEPWRIMRRAGLRGEALPMIAERLRLDRHHVS